MFFSVPPVHLALLCPRLGSPWPRCWLGLAWHSGHSPYPLGAALITQWPCAMKSLTARVLTCSRARTALTRMHVCSHSISSDLFSVLISNLRPTGRYFPYENVCLDSFSVGEFNALNM